ncbi:MAG: BLUF domain-containing protein [Alkalilacustris sp.]
MLRIVYFSSSPTPLSPEDLAALLAVSRRNNAADGITGLLLYHDQNFLQVLEGEEAAVTACFERIRRDPRHRNLIMVSRDTRPARSFGQWWMGFARMGDLASAGPGQIVALHELAQARLDTRQDPVVEKLVRRYLASIPGFGPDRHPPPPSASPH